MLFFPVVTYVCCAGKWTVPRGRRALVYTALCCTEVSFCVLEFCAAVVVLYLH
jgi:hypothetical protein